MALYIGIKNLIGKGAAWMRSAWHTILTQLATFRYRVAGGSDNSSLPERNGRAVFKKIYGNTVKWNQMFPKIATRTHNGVTFTQNANGSITISGIASAQAGSRGFNFPQVSGRKYFVQLLNTNSNISLLGRAIGGFPSLNYGFKNRIGTATVTGTESVAIVVKSGSDFSTPVTLWPMIIDLTAAEIDNLTTVEQVEAWLALNVGEQDYYPYDEGSLISFNGQGVRTIKNNVELDRLDLDVTKIYGKVNGEGSRYQCYPNGMLSTGSVHDTLSVNEAVVKVGSVDLGSLSYTKNTSGNYVSFYSAISNKATNSPIVMCSKYKYYGNLSIDKSIVGSIPGLGTGVSIRDDFYGNVSSIEFKAAMSGVISYYERKTPIIYTDLIYSEDGGVTGTPLTEFKYKVDKYSTEEVIVPASVAGEPTSTALVADIEYQAK